MQKVFGIGWAKTGTTTLGEALSILSLNHKTQDFKLLDDLMVGDYSKIIRDVEKYDSFDDWPWIILYKQLDSLFPNSKFILTTRDSSLWIKSYRNMLKNEGEASEYSNKIRSFLYNLDFPDVSDHELIECYERHISEVKRYFKYRKNDLLVIDWSKDDGWERLASFLNKDIPKEEFPHKNRGKY